MRFLRALAASMILTVQPVLAGEFVCPGGWDHVGQGCDSAECIAPMDVARIQIDRFASVEGVTLEEAFVGYEKIVGAQGTPVHDLLSETALDLAGVAAIRRDYAGSARGSDLRIALVLMRDGAQDILLRAIWMAADGAILEPMIGMAIADWDPRDR